MRSPVAPFSRRTSIRLAALIALAPLACTSMAAPWTYRGQLSDGGQPADGEYDIRLSLLDAREATSIGMPVTFHRVPVKRGAFSIEVDFGADLADAPAMKLMTEVAQGGSGFVPLGDPVVFDPKAALGAACWNTAGNTGVTEGNNILGIVEDTSVPLLIRAGNRTIATLQPRGGFFDVGDAPSVAFGSGANRSTAVGSTVSGGGQTSDGPGNFVEWWNSATGEFATVAGGRANDASAFGAVVSGGAFNSAFGSSSTVSGGGLNQATGSSATVPGGTENCAGGQASFAAGSRAKVRAGNAPGAEQCGVSNSGDSNGDEGTFVWADSPSPPAALTSTGPNQFIVRAQGGVGINLPPIDAAVELMIAADADNSDVANIWLKERDSNNGILMSVGNASTTINNNAEFFIDHYNGTAMGRRLELRNTGEVIIRSNISGANTGVTMPGGSGAWNALSDRNVKTAISAIDPGAILDRLVSIPISEWSYIAQGEGVRHLGPMAQDFAAAFKLGENDTTISSIDADGVALAAIQGLNTKLERENAALRAALQTVSGELAELRAAVQRLQTGEVR